MLTLKLLSLYLIFRFKPGSVGFFMHRRPYFYMKTHKKIRKIASHVLIFISASTAHVSIAVSRLKTNSEATTARNQRELFSTHVHMNIHVSCYEYEHIYDLFYMTLCCTDSGMGAVLALCCNVCFVLGAFGAMLLLLLFFLMALNVFPNSSLFMGFL